MATKRAKIAENTEEKDYAIVHNNHLSMKNNLKEVETGYIGSVVAKSASLWRKPKVESDEEVIDRIEWYFTEYAVNDTLPTVEGMALALGVSRMTLHNWENGIGCSEFRAELISRAKGALAENDAQLSLHNKIPQIIAIFRAKNYYGMKDTVENVTTIATMVPVADDATLKAKYLQDMPD